MTDQPLTDAAPSRARLLLGAAPVLIALGVASLLILALGHNPLEVFGTLAQGAFGTRIKSADSLVVWVSLTIVSSGLLITFRAGQWNIGIEGQIGMGALFAFGVARPLWDAPAAVALPAMFAAAVLGGVLWGVLAGLLKIYGGVNEIFGGLGLNFVTTGLTVYLIAGPWRPPGSSNVSTSAPLPQSIWLPTLPGLRLSPIAVVIALAVVITVYFSLRGTVWGLDLKAVGRNPRAAYLLGVPTGRVLLSAYAACGACAGLAGGLLLFGVRHQLIPNISGGHGFLGILIVLLSGFNGAWLGPIALFFAGAAIGGTALTLQLRLDSSLGGVLIGLLVLAFELVSGVRARRRARAAAEGAVP